MAIQLAKVNGCRVLTTAGREESIARCRELGADVVIDYKTEDVTKRVLDETAGKACPVVFDTVGGASVQPVAGLRGGPWQVGHDPASAGGRPH